MTEKELEEEIRDLLLIKLQECKLKPYGGAIYGDAAEYIAEALMDDIVGDLLRERDNSIRRQERFAEQEGFTPDCSPYYIAFQYKHKKEVAERALSNELVQQGIRIGMFDIRTWYYQALERAEKELAEERKDE